MDRVQFQPGLSTAEFFHRYGTDTLCEAALIQSRWPTGFVCPDCGCARAQCLSAHRRPALAVLGLSPPVLGDFRHITWVFAARPPGWSSTR
jgi:predicted RNA-binding Zn-ribbon protein involved in translation (DUF1610 family)